MEKQCSRNTAPNVRRRWHSNARGLTSGSGRQQPKSTISNSPWPLYVSTSAALAPYFIDRWRRAPCRALAPPGPRREARPLAAHMRQAKAQGAKMRPAVREALGGAAPERIKRESISKRAFTAVGRTHGHVASTALAPGIRVEVKHTTSGQTSRSSCRPRPRLRPRMEAASPS